MRVALLCEEAAGARALELVARGPHEAALVLTTSGSPVWRLAHKLGLAARPAEQVREPGLAGELARLRVDLLLNVHSLYIVPPDVLGVPAHGAYNLHPGPLPDYAGLNAPSWAIYHGEPFHGVTLHRMAPGIDTGPIALQARFPVLPDDTGLTLSLHCAEEGVRLIERLLAADLSKLPLQPQDLRARRYFGRGVPREGRIDWSDGARRVHAFVRACDYRPFASPWGVPTGELDGRPVQILKTAPTGVPCTSKPGTLREDAFGRTLVACGDEWLELVRSVPALRPPEPRSASVSRAPLSGSPA